MRTALMLAMTMSASVIAGTFCDAQNFRNAPDSAKTCGGGRKSGLNDGRPPRFSGIPICSILRLSGTDSRPAANDRRRVLVTSAEGEQHMFGVAMAGKCPSSCRCALPGAP